MRPGHFIHVVVGCVAWVILGAPLQQGYAQCSGITDPLQKAQCATANMQGTGALDRNTISNQQGAVPQYGGTNGCRDAACAGTPATGYYSNNGDVSNLNTATGAAYPSDPNAARVQQMGVDAGGWNLTTSSPVTTSNTVASTITPIPNSQSCSDVNVCTAWAPAPLTTQTCSRPGNGRLACQVEVVNTVRDVVSTGGPGAGQGWCVDHYMYVRVLNPSADSYIVQWLGTDPGGGQGVNCGGIGWRTFASFSFTPPTLAPDEQIVLVNFSVSVSIGGQCGSTSFSMSSGSRQVLTCGASGAQSGSIVATSWRKSWTIRKDAIDDRCAGVRGAGWTLMSTTCLDNAPRLVTLPDGSTQTFQPPTVTPANSCWLRDEQWGFTSSTQDTCAPLLSSGCTDVSSTCAVPVPGGCDTYSVTMQCGGGTICTQQTVVRQCTSCGSPGSYVPFCMDTSSPPNQNFQISATMMAMAQEVQNDFDKDTLQIFTGRRKSCTYSTLGTVIVDCCADDPSQMFGTCSDIEVELAGDKRAKQAIFVGTMCTEWWSIGFAQICAKKEDVYCTFNSQLARIIQQQGRPQLGQTFGTPEVPDCDGFTITEFASLNFQAMDFSEYFSQISSNFDSSAAATNLRQKACALDPSAPNCP